MYADLIARPIASIFNLCLSSGLIPNYWKSAIILLLLKGGDCTVLDNYRPISRLSVAAKVFESMVNELLKYYYSANNIFCQTLSGFSFLVYCYCYSFPVAQLVEHGISNAKIMGSIPRESKS